MSNVKKTHDRRLYEASAVIIAVKTVAKHSGRTDYEVFDESISAIDEARRLLKSIPHTDDGVPMVSGMRLWYLNHRNEPEQTSPIACVHVHTGNGRLQRDVLYPDGTGWTDFPTPYSSREAALEAAAKLKVES